MRSESLVEEAAPLVGYGNGRRYAARGRFLFEGIELDGRHVLDVGCGRGAWTVWAAINGARRVVGIEPEADGSTTGVRQMLASTLRTLGLEGKACVRSQPLEQLTAADGLFDVVIMFNVINHLDEAAVLDLHRDRRSFDRYVAILERSRELMKPGAWMIVADCGRHNLWRRLRVRSPVAPTIEWYKHQEPDVWRDVFNAGGFQCVDLRWSPLGGIRANRFMQYLTASHYVLRFRTDTSLTSKA